MINFQEMVLRLLEYWKDRDCCILFPYDIEKGAGTFSPHTFLRVLGKDPWRCCYVEPSRRPTDGRYGMNPNRLQHYFQMQVILKPAPNDSQRLFLDSLRAIGIDIGLHDIRFVEDDWESPTLGAWGLGWEVWLDGMEITQFTYFQQMGGIDLDPVCTEITYGLERLAMFIQDKKSVFDIMWNNHLKYEDIYLENERQQSIYNFDEADTKLLFESFEHFSKEAERLLKLSLVIPAFDYCLKVSHLFNLLDARSAISVIQRQEYIGRIRSLSVKCAQKYIESIDKHDQD